MRKISILGSTGSVGTQTLKVVEENMDLLQVIGLSGSGNIDLLEIQIEKFKPWIVSVKNKESAVELKSRIGNKIPVLYGEEGLKIVASLDDNDLVVTAVPGMVGLLPTLSAIDNGIDIALANKETLVAGGDLVMRRAAERNVTIYPVDSEHNAIFQCMMGNFHKDISKVILTASGGPFINHSINDLKSVTKKESLNHPKWSMGKKITIDSATLMNKGLEVIEAKWLFNLEPEQIEVVVHPQSIVHSLVEYNNHSTMAQLGYPDMKVPIQMALFYPRRICNDIKSLNLAEIGSLTFLKPDKNKFRCLSLVFDALKIGGSMPAVLNAANEIAVDKFLNDKISFIQISQIIESTMEKHNVCCDYAIDRLLEIDRWAREESIKFLG